MSALIDYEDSEVRAKIMDDDTEGALKKHRTLYFNDSEGEEAVEEDEGDSFNFNMFNNWHRPIVQFTPWTERKRTV